MSQNNIGTEKNQKYLSVLSILIVYVCIVSILNVILLAASFFYPVISLIISLFILLIVLLIFKIKVIWKDKTFHYLFFIILGISLLLRLSPNLYLTGGQDQGTYVSLSQQYEVNHGLDIKDELRTGFTARLKRFYDRTNILLGVDLRDKQTSEYVIPFYPVLPSWMATFSTIFGTDNRMYALTMFSMLSLVGVYLFTYEVTSKNQNTALLASFLLGINPLHVYFSRVPLTEIVSFTFLIFALYFLVKFYNSFKSGKINQIYSVLSLLSFTALFYTRMSAIFFLPVIVMIPVIGFLFCKEELFKKALIRYSIFWTISLALSYVFYRIFIPELYYQIIEKRIIGLIGYEVIILVTALTITILGAIILIKKFRAVVKKILLFISKYIYIFFIIFFLGLIFYELYFYVKEIFIDNGYSILSQESLSLFKQQSFLVGFLYLSPIGFVLLPISIIYLRKKKNVKIDLLITTISIFLIYCWGIVRLTQYHYYFARYQLSELIPLGIILISISLIHISESKRGKLLVGILVSIMTVYFGYFSFLQLQNYEGANKETFEEVKDIIGDKDLLLVVKKDFGSFNQITVPLKYYYNIKTLPLSSLKDIDLEIVNDETQKYENVYLLAAESSLSREDVTLVKMLEFGHNYFVHCNRNEDAYFYMKDHSKDIPFCKYIIIPNRYYIGVYPMYLYRLK
ncbi:MAG: Sulfatase [Candidatus Moranbacteria bacterium GW2011_GWD2_37_9]|uniref:Sulfatase n=1 Tax=Candidatus Nomurabacteria bacterium GW2011_GWE1_35_16 TaxID=1618761 RepID=A0A0G0BQU7_9BACT|nr:MAG: Sulfatase [Candidatus Nomurabacteria bacterium GW2011_GWE1_35_16]KKQ47585.1 MAG: Sulfatase [Candidatus Moranbacteria bacterium GW2011_GWD2_37_9]